MKRSALLAALACAAVACGGSRGTGGGGKLRKPALPPVNPDALAQFDAGMRALRLGGPQSAETAIPRLERAVDTDPNLWEAWHNLGVVRYRAGDDDAAITAFSRALKINPAHLPTLRARAEAYRRAGNSKRARADYAVLIEQQPDSPRAYARQASLLRESGDFEDALDVLRNALRRAGGSSAIYVELGLVYVAQGRVDLAELVLGKAVALDEKDPSIYNALALVALERGNDQLAFERFDHATSLDPSFHDARFNTAAVLLGVGDYQGALTKLQRVIEENPDDLDVHTALGVALRGLKKYDQAREAWNRVVKRGTGRVRGDALFNLAVLEMDFVMDEAKAKIAWDRYLSEAPRNHAHRKQAEERRKELGP